jgi:hypothetical protein
MQDIRTIASRALFIFRIIYIINYKKLIINILIQEFLSYQMSEHLKSLIYKNLLTLIYHHLIYKSIYQITQMAPPASASSNSLVSFWVLDHQS